MSRIRLKCGGKPRRKAFFGADGAVMAAATLAAAGITAGATALAAKSQSKAIVDSAKTQAQSIKDQTTNSNNLQKEQLAFTRSQNQENRQQQQDIQTTLQLMAGQENMNDRMEKNKMQVKLGGKPKRRSITAPFYGGGKFQVTDGGGVIPISVTKNKNLDVLLDEIEAHLKPGPAYYDTEEYTDQTLRQLAEETIREKALKLLNDEVPHGIYVETDKMKFRKNKTGEGIYDVSATIYCLRNSHKGIIIGKNGQMLKKIGTYAREDLEKMLDTKINLQLWVKVREDWLNDTALVKKFKLQ